MTKILENVNIDMDTSTDNKMKMAIAEAVKEGMIALQSLGGNSYGVFVEGDKYVNTYIGEEDEERECE